MIDIDLTKTLLSYEVYQQCKERLTETIFAEDVRDAYKVLSDAHDKYQQDLTTKELLAIWKAQNPVATKAEINEMYGLLDDIEHAEALTPAVANEVIEQLWRRDLGKKIAHLGLEVSEGTDEAMQQLTRLLERHSEGFMPDDFGEETTQDLDELLEMFGDDHRFRFNIETFSRHVYGIGRQEFGIIFATPETGKTAFVVSLIYAPGGFVDQDLKVMVLGNEEATKRTVVRGYQACTGMTGDEIQLDPDKAKQIYRAKTQGKVIFQDIQDWDTQKVDAYIAKKQPDIVFVDQLDKVDVAGGFEKGHERLREIYRQAREMAKRNNCAFLGVSQASNDATGKTRLHYSMMEGSKIGKAAEADLIIGIGKHNGGENDEPDNTRFLTVSKNKLSGWHGTEIVTIQPEISRYTA